MGKSKGGERSGIKTIGEVRPGDAAAYTTDQIRGAMPNGTIIEKCGSGPGDGHQDGDSGIVLGSIGTCPSLHGYFVAWSDNPSLPVFVASHRIRRVEQQ